MATPNTEFSTGAVLTAAQMNDMPFGRTSEFGGTATTAFTAATPLTVLTGAVTITAGRLYMVFGKLAVQTSGSATSNALYVTVTGQITRTLWYDTTAIGTNLCKGVTGFCYMAASELGVTSSTASRTFNLLWRSGAAGSLTTNPDNIVGAGTFPQRLIVLDVGKA